MNSVLFTKEHLTVIRVDKIHKCHSTDEVISKRTKKQIQKAVAKIFFLSERPTDFESQTVTWMKYLDAETSLSTVWVHWSMSEGVQSPTRALSSDRVRVPLPGRECGASVRDWGRGGVLGRPGEGQGSSAPVNKLGHFLRRPPWARRADEVVQAVPGARVVDLEVAARTHREVGGAVGGFDERDGVAPGTLRRAAAAATSSAAPVEEEDTGGVRGAWRG